MTDKLAAECKRLRALVEWYRQDLESRMTWFMHERAQAEQRVYELTTERDAYKRALEANLETVCGEIVGQYIRDGRVRIEVKDGTAVVRMVSPYAVTQ